MATVQLPTRKPSSALPTGTLTGKPAAAPGGHRWKYLLLVLPAGALIWWAIIGLANRVDANAGLLGDVPTHAVTRETLRVAVVEDGNVASARNLDVKCLVPKASTILWIIDDGTQVEKGTEIVQLDSSLIDEQLTEQKIVYEKARSSQVKAEEDLTVATMAVKEYAEGTFVQELQTAEANIIIAKENLKNAESMLDHSERMFRKGYVNEQQLDANRFAVQRCQLDLDAATTARKVLVDYTKVKKLKELESLREAANALMLAEKASAELEKVKLDRLRENKAACTIIAPQAGMVIYANEDAHRNGGTQIQEGTVVRENQTIVRLPDLSEMEIKVTVHETKIDRIQPGMPALIRVRDLKTTGMVESVATQPEPGRWFSSSVKEYAAIVRIDGSVSAGALKPGMTAEVEIEVAILPDVLTVPLLGVVEHNGKHYCYLRTLTKLGYERREVTIGLSNDAMMEVKEGLKEGDAVILNPRGFIAEAREATPQQALSARDQRKQAGRDTAPKAEKPSRPRPQLPSAENDKAQGTDSRDRANAPKTGKGDAGEKGTAADKSRPHDKRPASPSKPKPTPAAAKT